MITTFFIFSHFGLFILFPANFWVHLLIGVDIKGHSFVLLDLLFMCMLYFGFIFWYLCFSLENTWCINLSEFDKQKSCSCFLRIPPVLAHGCHLKWGSTHSCFAWFLIYPSLSFCFGSYFCFYSSVSGVFEELSLTIGLTVCCVGYFVWRVSKRQIWCFWLSIWFFFELFQTTGKEAVKINLLYGGPKLWKWAYLLEHIPQLLHHLFLSPGPHMHMVMHDHFLGESTFQSPHPSNLNPKPNCSTPKALWPTHHPSDIHTHWNHHRTHFSILHTHQIHHHTLPPHTYH